ESMRPDQLAAELASPVTTVISAGAIGTISPRPSMSRKTVAKRKASGRFIVSSKGFSPLAGTEDQIIGTVNSVSVDVIESRSGAEGLASTPVRQARLRTFYIVFKRHRPKSMMQTHNYSTFAVLMGVPAAILAPAVLTCSGHVSTGHFCASTHVRS